MGGEGRNIRGASKKPKLEELKFYGDAKIPLKVYKGWLTMKVAAVFSCVAMYPLLR